MHPDEVSGEEHFEVRGKRYDLVYRHLFTRRLEETPSAWVEDFFGTVPGRKAVLLNPPASPVEVKATFARYYSKDKSIVVVVKPRSATAAAADGGAKPASSSVGRERQ